MIKKIWLYALLFVILVGCNRNRSILTETPVIPANNEDEPCAFVWATKPLDELAIEIQDSMKSAGVEGVEVAAAAFGENCINTDGSIRGFGAMSVDINLTFNAPAGVAVDPQLLGERFEPAFLVLSEFTSENLPKPIQRISIQLKSESETSYYTTDLTMVRLKLDEGLHGAALVKALFGD